MPTTWLRNKHPELVTDLLRNFCLIHQALEVEFSRHSTTGLLDFDALAELIGQDMNQGRLWRLKDTAHLLFRFLPDAPPVGQLLDWSIGYIFHECMKLKEDAYQLQVYIPWFKSIQLNPEIQSTEQLVGSELDSLTAQTRESIRLEVERVSFVLRQCRKLFVNYLPLNADNPLLARLIVDTMPLMQNVFKDDLSPLIAAVYGDPPGQLYMLAARSFRLGGWLDKAEATIQTALDIDPSQSRFRDEKKRVASLRKKR